MVDSWTSACGDRQHRPLTTNKERHPTFHWDSKLRRRARIEGKPLRDAAVAIEFSHRLTPGTRPSLPPSHRAGRCSLARLVGTERHARYKIGTRWDASWSEAGNVRRSAEESTQLYESHSRCRTRVRSRP